MNIASIEIEGIPVRFAFEGKDIWITITDMQKVCVGDSSLKGIANNSVGFANKYYPKEAEIYFSKLPVLLKSGKPSKQLYWSYHIDIEPAFLGLSQDNSIKIENLIHSSIRTVLQSIDSSNNAL